MAVEFWLITSIWSYIEFIELCIVSIICFIVVHGRDHRRHLRQHLRHQRIQLDMSSVRYVNFSVI